jgi:hypothetical protein
MASTSLCDVRMGQLFCLLHIARKLAAKSLSTSRLTGIVAARVTTSSNSSIVTVSGARGGVLSGAARRSEHARTHGELGRHLKTFCAAPAASLPDDLLRLAPPSLLHPSPQAPILPGARSVLVHSGQDSVYVKCTIFPVLNRIIAVFPKSTLQQKRAVPALSLMQISHYMMQCSPMRYACRCTETSQL